MGLDNHLTGRPLLAVQAVTGILANHNYRSLPQLGGPLDSEQDYGHVSIIIPARDERHRLPSMLRSLAGLTYSDYEVVVVDDASSDGTGPLAHELGARVIRVETLPSGWTGKTYACQRGADATAGEWLLFTDADTEHGAEALSRALAIATRTRAGLVSLLARQRCDSFWERLLLPYAYALYFVGAVGANRPAGAKVANGQYMLFKRDAYERVGGHAAVRESMVEDVELANVAGRRGVEVVLARGEEHVQVRMYPDLPALWEGFAKNAVRFLSVSPHTGILTVIASISFLVALPRALRRGSRILRLGLLLVPACSLLPWLRRFGVPLYYAALYPLAALLFQLIALDSIRRALMDRQTTWKGRRY